MEEIINNPFRCLGVFANATLKERVAFETQMKAYARVGQRIDNPLQLRHLLGSLPNDEESIRKAESLLTSEDKKTHYAAFWFIQGPNPKEDLEAVTLLDKGKASTALEVWEKREDPAALQNLMVAYLALKQWEQALSVAHRLYHHERDIRRFASAVSTGKDFEMRQLVTLSSDNPLWDAVLKDLRTENCRNHIEQCLDDVVRCFDEKSMDALYNATADLDIMRTVLGCDNVVCQALAERMANALSQKNIKKFDITQQQKYLHAAFDLTNDKRTKEKIGQRILKNYMKVNASVREIRKDIPGAQGIIKARHILIGFGILGIVLSTLFRTCITSHDKVQPAPKINIPEYHKIEPPIIPKIEMPVIPTTPVPKKNIPDVSTPLDPISNLPSFSEEEWQNMRKMNDQSDYPLSDEEWDRLSKDLIKAGKITPDEHQELNKTTNNDTITSKVAPDTETGNQK